MIIHKKDGIYVKNVKYHVNIEDKEYYIDPLYVGKNDCFYKFQPENSPVYLVR